MAKPASIDLRKRVVLAVLAGGLRIPVIATGCSGASRPCVPIDRDQLEGGGLSAAG